MRNEPNVKLFKLDQDSNTITIEHRTSPGPTTRVVGFDEVAYLRYRRGLPGEYTPSTVDVALQLKSGERIRLHNGWPRYQAEFAAGMVEVTNWRSQCTKARALSDAEEISCFWRPPH